MSSRSNPVNRNHTKKSPTLSCHPVAGPRDPGICFFLLRHQTQNNKYKNLSSRGLTTGPRCMPFSYFNTKHKNNKYKNLSSRGLTTGPRCYLITNYSNLRTNLAIMDYIFQLSLFSSFFSNPSTFSHDELHHSHYHVVQNKPIYPHYIYP